MVDSDQLNGDPFFRLTGNSAWNACIGKQGTEENYLDGYMEAAIELVNTIIEKKMVAKRDTAVLPILYNARHAIELVLKFAINRLAAIGVLSLPGRLDHDIQRYLELLEKADLGDEALRKHISDLKPFVESLSRIDRDGQGLRYHIRRDGNQSLSDYSLANLEVIRDALTNLSKIISSLRDRIENFLDERLTLAHTKKLSRQDLLSIAGALPNIERWTGPDFDLKQRRIKTQYQLNDDELCEAISVIKKNREMKALVGGETTLIYLPDHIVVFVIEEWKKLHTQGMVSESKITSKFDQSKVGEMIENSRIQSEVVSALQARLTDPQLAELETMSSIGRHGWFPEFYEHAVQRTMERHALEKDASKQIADLMDNTKFLDALTKALRRLGRPSLANLISGV